MSIISKHPDRAAIFATISDAPHFTAEQIKQMEAAYPSHEREARLRGQPTLGSGKIFPIPESQIAIEHRDFPEHWPRIIGIDLGWTHNFAAAELVWDRDADCVYVSRTYRIKEATVIVHSSVLRSWGGTDVPIAWPMDGRRQTLEGGGRALAEQYRNEGLNLLFEHSQFEDATTDVEAGVMNMLVRMESGRLKVFEHLNDFWTEFRLYHRRDGKIFKENDDLLCAIRYGIMMLRYATTKSFRDKWNAPIEYPKVYYA
jgi:hypothetical protein